MLLKGNWTELLQAICWNLSELVRGTHAIAQNPQVCAVCVKFTRGTQATKCHWYQYMRHGTLWPRQNIFSAWVEKWCCRMKPGRRIHLLQRHFFLLALAYILQVSDFVKMMFPKVIFTPAEAEFRCQSWCFRPIKKKKTVKHRWE